MHEDKQNTELKKKRLDDHPILWRQLSAKQIISGLGDMTLHWIMRAFPIDLCSYVGGIFGRILGPKHKNACIRLRKNIRFLRPNISDTELDQMVKNWFENYGRVLAEFSVLRRIWKSNRTSIQGVENIAYANKTGRPLIFLALHTANWEVSYAKLLELFNNRGIYVYEVLKNRFQMKIAHSVRYPYANCRITPHPGSSKKIHSKLESNHFVWLAVDEHVPGKQSSPSFGRPLPASGNVLFALRSAKITNAVLLPVYVTRTQGAHFILNVLPTIEFNFNDFNDNDLKEAHIKIDNIIGSIVRQHVDQWYYAMKNDLFKNE
ncbi:MAG: hypothetical protein NTU49_06670 [Gammaproteobacteria bacterium]|nr:hypothetical protein [Gammaproteobacteria bacterium]